MSTTILLLLAVFIGSISLGSTHLRASDATPSCYSYQNEPVLQSACEAACEKEYTSASAHWAGLYSLMSGVHYMPGCWRAASTMLSRGRRILSEEGTTASAGVLSCVLVLGRETSQSGYYSGTAALLYQEGVSPWLSTA